jgi:UDP-N-acetylglucosamine acyltransferase
VTIHPTAIVADGARVAEGAVIGPYCVVGPDVELAGDVELISHVSVAGRTRIGPRSRVWPFASIGHQPQDLKYRGEASRLEIGADCMIREHVTVNPGTKGGGMLTRIGDGCLLMAGAHVAHDCQVGERVVMANAATLAGHVEVGDHAVIGGLSAVHQHVRIGTHAMVGGMSGVEKDVAPYCSAVGNRAVLAGLNLIGLKRRGFGTVELKALRGAYDIVFVGEGPLAERAGKAAAAFPESSAVQVLAGFIRAGSSRSFCTPREG